GDTRQLTTAQARDANPQWSPDGRQIAFLSTRRGKPQIFVIPVDGGEARPLTSMAQGVASGPAWSPNGQRIAFSASPLAEQPDLAQPYRLTRHTYRFDELGYLDGVVQDIYVVDAAGGEARQLTSDASNNTTPLWSPDGREILFNTTMAPDTHRGYFPRLRVVNLEGHARELTGDWGYSLSAAWTPDGGRVVFCGSPHGRPIGSKNDLWVIDRSGGAPECRTPDLTTGVGRGLQ